MTKNLYDKSIATEELQLVGIWQQLAHFGLVAFLIFMPLMVLSFHLIDFIQSNSTSFQEGEIWLLVIPSILSIVVYWIQKKRLKFRIIKTNLNGFQLKEILIEVSEKLGWEFVSTTDVAYIAKTDPDFFSGSWGEQITVLFYKDLVLVNSICDPTKRPSVISWGRNRRNENTLINKINEVGTNLA